MGKRKRRRMKKPAGKVKLPCDCAGRPINVGDVIEFRDGTCFKVAWMTYFGEGKCSWCAEGDGPDEWSDNLKAALVVRRKR